MKSMNGRMNERMNRSSSTNEPHSPAQPAQLNPRQHEYEKQNKIIRRSTKKEWKTFIRSYVHSIAERTMFVCRVCCAEHSMIPLMDMKWMAWHGMVRNEKSNKIKKKSKFIPNNFISNISKKSDQYNFFLLFFFFNQ